MTQAGYPSPFYDLVEVDAFEAELVFPVLPDGRGPYWDEDGCVPKDASDTDVTWVDVHDLGDGRYRIVCNEILGQLTLGWGDEFYASQADDALRIEKVVVPRPFRHFRLNWSGMNNDAPQARILHEMGGGWERLATSILTVTVPTEKVELYFSRLEAEGCPLSGLFAREL
jgi:hypothetical protein